jgi:uncharacterized membrane protein
MNKRKILALLVAMAAGGVVHGQVSFTGLGDLPGGLFYSWGSSVSADGRAVVGRSNGVAGSVASYHAIRWTREGGMEAVSLPAQWAFGSYAVGTSQDGSVVAGNAFVSAASTTEPFVWTPGGVTLLVGPVNGFGRANRVSADGTTVVGQTVGIHPTQNFAEVGARWTNGGGGVPLGWLPNTNSCDATVVSRDGSIILGSCYATGTGNGGLFRWTQATGIQLLDTQPAGTLSWSVAAMSEDGTVVCGAVLIGTPTTGSRSSIMRWTQSGGATLLDPDPSHPQSECRAMSPDGKAIVGYYWMYPAYWANVWTAETGLLRLDQYLLTRHGFQPPAGWVLERAMGISDDKRTIVGEGMNPNGQTEGWIITLPWPVGCYANCDESTAAPKLNANDFQCFLNRFAAGDSIANCDGSTAQPSLNVNDFQCFMNAFAAGCG